ncbi:MAG: hypothetical protein K2Q18_08205, partial [Bdellovibrionales bacterium]|nr:hypothetical protein [Bdellovibrionales bacterium]
TEDGRWCLFLDFYGTVKEKQGYIPFLQPMADVGVGALLKGSSAKLLSLSAPGKTCFPNSYNGVPTELIERVDVDLPEIVKKINLTAGADVDVLAANGTPIFKLKSGLHMIKSINVHIEKASIEYLNDLVFSDWVNSSMSVACKTYLEKGGSFVRQALKVEKMSFQFLNDAGGEIIMSADNIEKIVNIDANVKWEITNGYTLTITSPKYIGFHLARVSPLYPGTIELVASSYSKDFKFNFRPISFFKKNRSGFIETP